MTGRDMFDRFSVSIRTIRFRKMLSLALCAAIVLSLCSLPFVRRAWSAAALAVTPTPITVLGTGETFSVNVTVVAVTDLYACEFNLYFDSTLMYGVSITEGPFLRSQGITFFLRSFTQHYNDTHGFARVGDAVLGDVPGVSGSGVIATITFQSTQVGSSNFELGGVKLSDSNGIPMFCTTYGGVVQIVPVVRDVAVTSVIASTPEALPGEVVNVSAIVLNEGGGSVSFDVSAYAGDVLVGLSTVWNLASGSYTTVTIPWNTTGFSLGNYTIRAEAEPHPEETDLADNVFIDGNVTLVSIRTASLSLQPQTSKVNGLDVEFGVNLMVADTTDLYGWQIKLYYDSASLNGTRVTEGSFLKTWGSTYFYNSSDDKYNATHGQITLGCSLLGNVLGVSGSGLLATVYFKTRIFAASLLLLSETKLGNETGHPMAHTVAGGVVEILQPWRDVALENVVLSRNEVGVSHSVNVSVAVSNKGTRNEDFTINFYANDTLFGSLDVLDLAVGTRRNLVYVWNTTGLALGSICQVKAEATPVPDEIDLGNNVFVDGFLTVTQGIHDVAISRIVPQYTILYEGSKMNITVVASNRGDFSETFSVTLYYGTSTIAAKTVTSLPYGQDQSLTYAWDTTGVASNQSYALKAVAGVVAGETNGADNTFTDGNVTIIPGSTVSMSITNVIPSDQFGNAQSSFVRGTMAYFKIAVSCNSIFPEFLLLTVNVYDANRLSLTVISFRGYVAPGSTSFILGSLIPTTSNIGSSAVYVNALTDWPHLGGTPYCPEKTASFQIKGS